MLNEKMLKAINEQINAEMYSSYLYLSMSAWFQSTNLPGCANWMRVQGSEEWVHAMKLYDYVNDRGGRVTLEAIEKPQSEWKSPLAAFEAVKKHEQKVTGLINSLADLAIDLKDHATMSFLKWFIDEQVEEESSADELVNKFKMVGDAAPSLLMLDNQLGQRVSHA